jgi:Mn2+/Fe2+ NRAMP family transporter
LLFSAGLFNASLFAASILPLSTAYTVCEGLGFESGVSRSFKEAPIFYGLFTFLIVVGGATVLLPNVPLVELILLSQVINGALLPVVLVYMIILVNKKRLMKDWKNSAFYNMIAWLAVIIISGLTLALVGITIRQILA